MLTSQQIKHLQPKAKSYFVADEKGLRLLVHSNGSLYWRLKYRFAGKQKTLAIGVYPDVTLKEARVARDKARLQILEGVDPARERKVEQRANKLTDENRFSVLARQWWEHQKAAWTEDHAERLWRRLRNHSFEALDAIPVAQITPLDIIEVVQKIEQTGNFDLASRILQDVRRTFSYGVKMGKLKDNPARELTGVLKPYKSQHRASLPNSELGMFLSELRGYEAKGRLTTKLALQMVVFTFSRPGEVRCAEWSEFDIEQRIWRIPAKRMKMKTEHLVPLSYQVIKILSELRPITGQYDLLFPSDRERDKPISDNTMRLAMFRMGYDGSTKGKSKATPHGFRSNASSILNEEGFNADAVERQLSHMERNNVRAAYTHHAQYLEERKKMMQWWADYLDELASKAAKTSIEAGL